MRAYWLLVAIIAVVAIAVVSVQSTAVADDPDRTIPTITVSSPSAGEVQVVWGTPSETDTLSSYRVSWALWAENGFTSYKDANSDTGGNAYPDAPASSYTITGLAPGEYAVYVRARYEDSQNGPFRKSAKVVVGSAQQEEEETPTPAPTEAPTPEPAPEPSSEPTPEPTPAPGAITGLTLVSSQPGHLWVSWDEASPAPTEYRLNWAPVDDPFPSWDSRDGGNLWLSSRTAQDFSNLVEAGVTYKLRMRAIYKTGPDAPWSGPWSETVTQRVRNDPPGAPTAVSVDSVAHDGVVLSWSAPAHNGLTGYRILRGSSADALETIVDDTGDLATGHTDTAVSEDTTYHYAVMALSLDGDGAQSATVSATTPPPQGQNDLRGTRQDDPDPAVTVRFGQATYTVAESDDSLTTNMTENEVAVKVTLSADPLRSVTIPITKANEGGATDADYSGVPASVTFASGETERTITFTAVDDADSDDGESVKLGFGTLPARVSAGSPDEATVAIDDDDAEAGVVRLSTSTPRLAIPITATLTDADGGVTGEMWQWSRGDTAMGAFTDISGATSATFRPGEADLGKFLKATVTYTDAHGSQTASRAFNRTVGNPSNVKYIDNLGEFTGATEQGSPGFATQFRTGGHPAGYKITEITITLFGTYSTDTTSMHIYSSDAEGDPDQSVFRMISPSAIESWTNFAGPRGKRLEPNTVYHVAIVSTGAAVTCRVAHANRMGSGQASDWSTAGLYGLDAQGSYTDTSSGDGCGIRVGVNPALDTSYIESVAITSTPANPATYVTGETLKATVTMSEAVTVNTTTPPTLSAVIGANTRTMMYNSTDSTGTALVFEYTVVAEDEDQDGVSFGRDALTGTITRASDGKAADLEHEALDDSEPLVNLKPEVTVSFGQATYSIAEGGSVDVQVNLSADPERSVTIPITKVNEGGALDGDYSGVPESVTFASGDTEKTITFTAVEDTVADNRESVKLGFGTLPPRVIRGATTETTITITDDTEWEGVVSLSAEQPEMGIPMTASLTDADGGVTGTTWQWSRGDTSDGAFTDITNATSTTYRPAEEDLGKYLKATATYTDSIGSGKTASNTADNAVHVVNRTFVDNLGQLSRVLGWGEPGQATQFRTGGHPAGYTLSEVTVRLRGSYSHSTLSVHVYSSDSGGNLGSSLYRMVSPSTLSGVTTFTAPVAERLSPDTRYYLALVSPRTNIGCRHANEQQVCLGQGGRLVNEQGGGTQQ